MKNYFEGLCEEGRYLPLAQCGTIFRLSRYYIMATAQRYVIIDTTNVACAPQMLYFLGTPKQKKNRVFEFKNLLAANKFINNHIEQINK